MALIDNLISYYKLDEASGNALDADGNTYDLTEIGTVPSQTGKISNARGAYSTSNYFTNPSVLSLNQNVNYSISLWVYRTASISVVHTPIEAGGDATNDYRLIIRFPANNKMNVLIVRQGVGINWNNDSTADVALNTWTHVVFTYNGSTREGILYMSGSADKTATATSDTYNSVNDFRLGLSLVEDAPLASGYIDEVGYWNKTLTPTEVTALWNDGNGLTYPFVPVTNMKINIGDVWKDVVSIKINIGDVWKDVVKIQQNIGDVWKDVFG